jgi:hypothetical protein
MSTMTVQAFNSMLKNFLDELCSTFPDVAAIRVYTEGFDTLVKANARKPLQMFMEAVSPHTDAVMRRDPELFSTLSLGGIDFKTLWASDISDATRNAIWQYLHMLFLLATTVSSVPPELLSSIESVAQNCADKMQEGQMDFSSMSKMLMGGGAGAEGLLGGLGGLLGGMGMGGMGGAEGFGDIDIDAADEPEGAPADAVCRRPKPATKKAGGRRK